MSLVAIIMFIGVNAALTATSLGLVRRSGVATGPGAWLAGFIFFASLAEAILLTLGSLGQLGPWQVAATTAALLLAERLLPGRPARPTPAHRPPSPAPLIERLAVGLACGAGLWWLAAATTQGLVLSWDDLGYHASTISWWLQNGSIGYPPLTYQVYYPLNAELFAAWFAAPLGTLAQSNLSQVFWIGMLTAAALTLDRRLGRRSTATAVVLACFLVSPKVLYYRGTVSANDLAIAVLLIAMIVTCLPARGRGSDLGGDPRWWALLGGLAGGMALGIRATIVVIVGLVGLWWVVAAWRRRVSWSTVLWFAGGVALLGSFWYLRNWIVTGNPVFPAEVGPFAGPFDPAAQRETSLIHQLGLKEGGAAFWSDFLRLRLDWPLPVGIAAAVGFVGGLWPAVRGLRGERRTLHLLLWLACLVFLLVFPHQPFSGSVNRPGVGLIDQPRFLTFPMLLGLLLLPSLISTRRAWAGTAVAAAMAVVFAVSAGVLGADGALWIAVGVGTAAVAPRIARAIPRNRTAWLPAALILALWIAVGATTPAKQTRAVENLHAFPESWVGWKPRPDQVGIELGRTWALLDNLPDGSRVAEMSNLPSSNGFYQQLFGSELQLVPVQVHRDGRARGRLHQEWRDEPAGWWWEFRQLDRRTPPDRFRANLNAAGVDYLVLTKWPRGRDGRYGRWPVVRATVEQAFPAAQRLHADGYTEIWKVSP